MQKKAPTTRDLILDCCYTSKTILEISVETRISIDDLSKLIDSLKKKGLLKERLFKFEKRYYRANRIIF